MPRFIVTSGSHFEPFTYDELIKPVAQMQQAHDAANDAYEQLSLETSALQNYISDNPGDARAKKMYDDYMAKLVALRDNLFDNGVTAQTKRDLASARATYASDIARLQTAIQNRQARSKEYWDTKHKNPDMIMGEDPGLSGLDNYLADDLYGSNYYTYSGQQFMNEVGTDAKARAQELMRNPQYQKNPELAGYITRITQEGFTSQEVQNASAAVQQALATGDTSSLAGLPVAEGILADVLLSHLESTGARGSVSSSEYDRLFDYGRAGLSQAIGGTKTQDLSDKQWDYNRQLSLARETYKINHPEQMPVVPTNQEGYTWNGLIQELTSPGYEKLAKTTGSAGKKYEDGPKMIVNPDGTSTQVNSPWEMMSLVFDPESRRQVREHMGGLDVAMPSQNWLGTTDSKQQADIQTKDGRTIHVVTGKLSDADADRLGISREGVAIYYGQNKIHDELTRRFNKAREEYEAHVQAFRDANPGIKLEDYAISPKKERELREKYKVNNSVQSSDLGSLVMTSETQGDYTPAVLVGTDSGFDYARENYGRAIVSAYNHAASNSGGTVGKGSRFAFYKVGEGGMVTDQKGETDIKKVFGTTSKGVIEPSSISDISFLPQDIAAGAGNGRPQFRFSTTASTDVWSADASMLGTLTYNALKAPRYSNGWSACDAVSFMMEPLLNPGDILSAGDEASSLWSQLVFQMLNDTSQPITSLSSISGPIFYGADGQPHLATAKDVVRSQALQNKLYDAVRDYIDKIVSVPRDMNNIDHPQNVGNSSTKAARYLP